MKTAAVTNIDLQEYERVARVRDELMNIIPQICSERATIITESVKQTEGEPHIIRRAKALDKILSDMSIFIEPGQMIVGNQCSVARGAPIFPEYSVNWVIDELDSFSSRTGDRFEITEDVKSALKNMAPYWTGKTHQEEVFGNLTEKILDAGKQNVLHFGGISMSGDGHIIPNHQKVLSEGLSGLIEEAEERRKNESLKQEQIDFYDAAIISLNACIKFARRFSKEAHTLALKEKDVKRHGELLEIAEVNERIFSGQAQSFLEAVQVVYYCHLVMMIESNGHSFSFGRFDQYIAPYYYEDIENGKLTPEVALEILALFFVKLNSINKVRPWSHTEFGVGYPLYSNLMVGGMKSDGADGTNDITYLALYAMDLSRMPEPNLSVRYHKGTPRLLLKEAAKLIREGFGMPSLFVDEVAIEALKSIGLPEEVARDYASMGCVEIAIPGKWGHRATGMTYINFAKILDMVLRNGYDKDSGIQQININGNSGSEINYLTYDEVFDAWKSSLEHYTDLAVECDRICDNALVKHDADPFASSIVDSAIERGMTLKSGGAKYDFVSHSTIGTTVVGDSLAAIKKLVFDDKAVTLKELVEALDSNWAGDRNETIRLLALNAPKFGNDLDYVDEIVAEVYNSYLDLLPNYHTTRYGKGPIGAGYTMSTSNISSYVPYGLDVGATPNGRFAGKPLNEGASPCLSADENGPTAVVCSVSKLPNARMAGGQLLNMKFSPTVLENERNLETFVYFLDACREMGIFHHQYNIVDSKILRAAKEKPEDYPNLMVRVAGYCALFNSLIPNAQEAIIERTEHASLSY